MAAAFLGVQILVWGQNNPFDTTFAAQFAMNDEGVVVSLDTTDTTGLALNPFFPGGAPQPSFLGLSTGTVSGFVVYQKEDPQTGSNSLMEILFQPNIC